MKLQRAECQAAPKPARIPMVHELGHCVTHEDRSAYSPTEGLT